MKVVSSAACSGVLAVVIALFLAGCGDSNPTQLVDPEIQAAENSIFLSIGEGRTIAVAVAPPGTAFQASSDDTEVATVSQSAAAVTISGVKVGFATVTLVLPAHPGVSTQISVEVIAV